MGTMSDKGDMTRTLKKLQTEALESWNHYCLCYMTRVMAVIVTVNANQKMVSLQLVLTYFL